MRKTETKYLGQTPVDLTKHPMYSKYTPSDWALHWIVAYGGIDGDHHKNWVIDQVARILKGTPVIGVEAAWDNGRTEMRFWLDEPSPEYIQLVKDARAGEDGPETYGWNEGIAP
jgi:hypothetical protein